MKKKRFLALLITLIFLGFIFYKINWRELIQTFKLFHLNNLWKIISVYILSLYLRGVRWKALLMNDKKYKTYDLGVLFTVGSMLNVYLPARAGDIYRAYYLGKTKNEKKMKIFGNIILERLLDGICIFIMLISAILIYFNRPWILNIAYSIGFIFIVSFIIFYLIFKFNKVEFVCKKLIEICSKLPQKISVLLTFCIKKIENYINSFIEGFEVLNNVKCTSEACLLSVAIWLSEAYVTYLIINSFHINLGFSAALFIISLTSFSTMIPSTSMFLGPYQCAYILALGIYNVNKSTTLAISTIHQGIMMIILTIIGGIYLFKYNSNFSIEKMNENDIIQKQ